MPTSTPMGLGHVWVQRLTSNFLPCLYYRFSKRLMVQDPATSLEVPSLEITTEASSVWSPAALPPSCVTAACLPRVPSGSEDTLSLLETEVISRHTAHLCELCKHTRPPHPNPKTQKGCLQPQSVLGRGNEEGILRLQRPRRKKGPAASSSSSSSSSRNIQR